MARTVLNIVVSVRYHFRLINKVSLIGLFSQKVITTCGINSICFIQMLKGKSMYDTCYYIYEVVIKLHFIINKITIVENDN